MCILAVSRNLLCREFLTLGFYLLIFCLIKLFSINLPELSRSYSVSQMSRIKMKLSTCLNMLSNSSKLKNVVITKNCKTTATRETYFGGKCFQELLKMQTMCCCQVCCLPLFLYRLWHHEFENFLSLKIYNKKIFSGWFTYHSTNVFLNIVILEFSCLIL